MSTVPKYSPTPLAAVVAGVLGMAMLTAAPAAAGQIGSADGPGTAERSSISLSLRPSGDVSAVTRSLVKGGTKKGWASRGAALQTVAPSGQAKRKVRAWAAAQGLTVSYASDWLVTVDGPADTLATAFGTNLTGTGESLHATTSPTVPAALGSAVVAAGGLDNRPVWRHQAIPGGLTGADLADAYQSAPSMTGAGITVATIQFSGWRPQNLTTYAAAAGIPLAAGQVTTIAVQGAQALVADGDSGTMEVALDTTAILATAPKAKQRVYVANNSWAGALAVYDQIAQDAADGLVQVVSESWGLCEYSASGTSAYNDARLIQEASNHIDRIVAAGATMFASSGDAGAYGCSYGDVHDATPSVAFPASAASVVAVGGTRLTRTGSGWTERTWEDASDRSASGGGISRYVARPAWQASVNAGSTRTVPDVAAVADPATGLGFYWKGGWYYAGGTSLSSPIWAGQLAGVLSAVGATTGLGSIHQTLYAHPEAFRDVTVGGNFLYSAGPGYDLTTGLGTPDWAKLGPLLTTGSGSGVAYPLNASDSVTSLRTVAGTPQRQAVGGAFAAVTVEARNTFGSPVPGATVAWSAPGTGATGAISQPTTLTDADGRATVNVRAGSVAGSWTLGATAGTAFASAALINQGPAGTFTTVAMTRVADTRSGLGVPRSALYSGRSVKVALLGRARVPATAVESVTLRATVITPTRSGTVTVGGQRITARAGRTTVAEVTVPAGTTTVTTSLTGGGRVHVVLDVVGFTADGNGVLGQVWHRNSATPVLDTRSASFGAGQTGTVSVAGVAGVGATATAVRVKVTLTGTTAPTTVKLWAAGQRAPSVTVASLAKGQTATITLLVPLGSGAMGVAGSGGKVRMQLAVGSWLAPTTVV